MTTTSYCCPDPREVDDLSALCTPCLLAGLADAIDRVNTHLQERSSSYSPDIAVAPTLDTQ